MSYTPRLVRFRIDSFRSVGGQQLVTGRTQRGEGLKDIPRPEPHGFASNPPQGAVGVALALGPDRSQMVVMGVEHPDQREGITGAGHQAIYDGHGNVVSLVQSDLRIVGTNRVTIVGPKIVLDGEVHLGGEGGKPIGIKGTLDDAGDALDANLATKVFAT